MRHATPDTVILTDAAGARVPATLAGTGPDGPIETLSDTSVITSLTIQPRTALAYATRYTLTLTSGIEDRDIDPNTQQPAPKALIPYTTSFTTFGPEVIGQTEDQFTAGGMAILGDRAYVAQNSGSTTTVRLFDISDPVSPIEITGPASDSFALRVPRR